jgi:hypothetical protein
MAFAPGGFSPADDDVAAEVETGSTGSGEGVSVSEAGASVRDGGRAVDVGSAVTETGSSVAVGGGDVASVGSEGVADGDSVPTSDGGEAGGSVAGGAGVVGTGDGVRVGTVWRTGFCPSAAQSSGLTNATPHTSNRKANQSKPFFISSSSQLRPPFYRIWR